MRYKFWSSFIHSTPFEMFLFVRRWIYVNFRKDYVKQSLDNRKGECSFPKCDCCSVTAVCKYNLGYKKGCAIQSNKKNLCSFYPIDEFDKPRRIPECSYYWLPGAVGALK